MLVGIPAASDYLSSRRQAGAVSDATGAQIASNGRAMRIQQDTQREVLAFMGQIYGDQVARQLPFYNSGVAALSKLNQGLGLDVAPSAPPQTFQPRPTSTLANLPSYQAPYNETAARTGGPGAGDLALTGLSLATPWLAGLGSSAATGAAVTGGTAATGAYGAAAGKAAGGGASVSGGGGGFGSSLATLASNPLFWGQGAAAAVAVPWLKSQAHWEANTLGKNEQQPFHTNVLEKGVSEFNRLNAEKKMTPEIAGQFIAKLDQEWDAYQGRVNQYATGGSDERTVSRQSLEKMGPIVAEIRSSWAPYAQAPVTPQAETINLTPQADGSFGQSNLPARRPCVQARPKEDLVGKAINLRNLGQQSRINELNIQNAETAQRAGQIDTQKAAAVDRIFGQSVQEGWEPDRTRQALYQVDPAVAQQWDAYQVQRENQGVASIKLLGGVAAAMKDATPEERQAMGQSAVSMLQGAGVEQLAERFAQYQWTDAEVNSLLALVTEAQDTIDANKPITLAAGSRLVTPGGEELVGAEPTPTTGERDFQSDYQRMLAADGLKPSARLEADFKRQWDAAKKTTTGNLQAELAGLYTKRDTGGLTSDESARLNGIESAMGYVANQYGSGYQLMTTPEGQTVVVQKSTGEPVGYVPENIRPQFTAAEREELSLMDEILTQLDTLEQLGEGNRGSIGVVQGRVAATKRATVGASDDVNEMFRISDNVADMLLRARSGAQINEQEYGRLRSLIPNARGPEGKFFSDLEGFRAETQRVLERRTGARPLTTPANSPGSETPTINQATLDEVRAYARSEGITEAEARRLFEADGITVGQ